MKRSFGVICGVLAAWLLVSGCVREDGRRWQEVPINELIFGKKSSSPKSPDNGRDVDISGAREKPDAPTQPETVLSKNGLTVELHRCAMGQRNSVVCIFTMTSNHRDRNVSIRVKHDSHSPAPKMYDNVGNEYYVAEIQIANRSRRNRYARAVSIKIFADASVRSVVKFNKVSTEAKSIHRLIIPINSEVVSGGRATGYISFSFRNIPIS